MSAHHCHVPGCSAACPPAHLTCGAHWRLVPRDIQIEVYATVGKRAKLIDASWAPWWRAQTKAIHAIMRAEGRDLALCEVWLEKELRFVDTLESR